MRWTRAKTSFGCTSWTQTPHKAAAPTSKRAHTDRLPLRVSFKLPLFSTVESRKIPQTSKRETEKAILPYLNWAPILIMILHIGTWEGSGSCRAAGARHGFHARHSAAGADWSQLQTCHWPVIYDDLMFCLLHAHKGGGQITSGSAYGGHESGVTLCSAAVLSSSQK